MPTERYQLYHMEKARGGLGLTIFGGSSTVSPDCPATFGQIDVSDDRVVPYFEKFAGRIHDHGAAIMCQISHTGRRTRWDRGAWLPPISPSSIREPEHRSFPKAMEDWDIERVIQDFASAARRCKEGGLDGCELSFWANHLVPQFWSAKTNQRADEYGGSLENRMRFGENVLKAVRDTVGPDFIVGVRIAGDELLDGGLTQDDCVSIAKAIEALGIVDFLNIGAGNAENWRSHAVLMANMAFPVAPFLYLPSALKKILTLPILHAHRLPDVNSASKAIEEGHIDLVGMTRAHIADPHIVNKLRDGRPDNIRQCVGANYCVDRTFLGGDAVCIQNVSTGREYFLPHDIERAKEKKKVVVVGGGVAGLEAARVSTLRGHKVILFEGKEHVGGQITVASKATWRGSLAGIVRWLEAQVVESGVDLRLNATADLQSVLDLEPDVVIVATGGSPVRPEFSGGELCVTVTDVLTGHVQVSGDVLIYDDNGSHHAMSCAEVLCKNGCQVEIVTPDRFIGPEIGGFNYPVHLRALYEADVVFSPDLVVTSVGKEGNRLVPTLRNDYTLKEEERLVDAVVFEHGTLPNDDLYFELKPHSRNIGAVDLEGFASIRPQRGIDRNPEGTFNLFRCGDAVASRNIHAAIFDANRFCRTI